MPLVRIDLPDDTPAAQVQAVGDAVHQALVDIFAVPVDDRFQVISRHAPGGLVWPPQYLGVRHGARLMFVQITAAPGRTVGQKEALYARIAAGVARDGGFAAADVVINLVESARENWSFGEGLAQYAEQDRRPPAALRAAA